MKYKYVLEEYPSRCDECPLRSYEDLALICTPMRKCATDIDCPLVPEKDGYDDISIKWLHREMIEALYEKKISGEVLDVFRGIIAKWDKKNER